MAYRKHGFWCQQGWLLGQYIKGLFLTMCHSLNRCLDCHAECVQGQHVKGLLNLAVHAITLINPVTCVSHQFKLKTPLLSHPLLCKSHLNAYILYAKQQKCDDGRNSWREPLIPVIQGKWKKRSPRHQKSVGTP